VQYSPACIQSGAFYANGEDVPKQSEDCLTLNVWTPVSVSAFGHPLLPVLVYVHGGGLQYGASSNLGCVCMLRMHDAHAPHPPL
jgi:para-nitrobenzyl esterase